MKHGIPKIRFLRIFPLLMWVICVSAHYLLSPWGFYWKVSPEETALRMQVVSTAQQYLGCQEADGSHQQILDIYNHHQPLAMDYTVDPTDSWCATFVSCVSIECDITQILPTECGCQRQIELFRQMDCWEEQDSAIPLPGDVIYYDWEDKWYGDCTGWSDHVGIVVGVKWPFAKVIEGNKDDQVAYRYILLNGPCIRGYGKPDYTTLSQQAKTA